MKIPYFSLQHKEWGCKDQSSLTTFWQFSISKLRIKLPQTKLIDNTSAPLSGEPTTTCQ